MWPLIEAYRWLGYSGDKHKGSSGEGEMCARGLRPAVTSHGAWVAGPGALTTRGGIGSDLRHGLVKIPVKDNRCGAFGDAYGQLNVKQTKAIGRFSDQL